MLKLYPILAVGLGVFVEFALADWDDISPVIQTSTLCDLTQTVQPIRTLAKLYETEALTHNVSNTTDTDKALQEAMYALMSE